jgi:hypothetical protein
MTMQTDTGSPKAHRGEMAIMGKEGDTKHIWSKTNRDETDAARVLFDSLTKKGHTAFRVTGKEGEKGEQMRTFDPEAERIIFVPPVQAG